MDLHSRLFLCLKQLMRTAGVAAIALAAVSAAAAPPVPARLLRAGVDKSQARLMADIAQSQTAVALAHQLEVLAWDAPLKIFPAEAPAPGVLVDYLKNNVCASLDTRPIWRAHRGNWRGAMRTTLLASLQTPLTRPQLRHVVSVLPLFAAQDDLAATTHALRQAISLNMRMGDASTFEAEIFRRGLRRWVLALWRQGGNARAEVLRALLDGVRDQAHEPGTGAFLAKWNETLGLTGWLVSNPKHIDRVFGDRDKAVRQRFLALILENEPAAKLQPVQDRLDPGLIEALQGDNVARNQANALERLAPRAAQLQPLLYQAFLASNDWRQKTALAGLLDSSNDPAVTEDLMMFAYRLLASVPVENFPRANDCCWPGPAGQVAWASDMLVRMGEPARDFVADRLRDTMDPRQAALGLQVLAKHRVPDRVWDERLMRLLVFGIDSNAPETQRDLCAAALQLAPAAVQERLREIAAEPGSATQLVVRDAIRGRAEDHITAYNTLLREPAQ